MGTLSYQDCLGILPRGERNQITDVPGVRVGHVTLSQGAVQTGVTAVIPGAGSAFRSKFPAAVHVINGFGKSIGLMQIAELGTLETPILLTNTFSVPACAEGLLSYMLFSHPEIGRSASTVNPVVMECNDGPLNDIRARNVRPEHALQALADASEDFAEGAVGAGRGMTCYGWKGGIGSASRRVTLGEKCYTVGALLLTNFGETGDLRLGNRRLEDASVQQEDKGSCIILLATDAPLSSRQLARCTRRAQNGLARTGSFTGTGSGDIALMFSTANRIPYDAEAELSVTLFPEGKLNGIFRAVTECVEESVISSLEHAEGVTGRDGNRAERAPL